MSSPVSRSQSPDMVEFDLTLVTVNQTPLDLQGNSRRITGALQTIRDTVDHDVRIPHIVCFPELALTGYGCEDAFYMPHLLEAGVVALGQLARDVADILPGALVFAGLPVRYGSLLYNCQAALHDGRVAAVIPKSHLAGEGLHYEPRWFHPWRHGNLALRHSSPILDGVPAGRLLLDYRGVRIGLEICEDAWVADRPARSHYDGAVDVILNPAASHSGFGKYDVRRSIVESSSRQYHCVYGTVNLLGNEAGRSIYDGARILAADGAILHESERFSFLDAQSSTCRLSLSAIRNHRNRLFSRRQELDRALEPGQSAENSSASTPVRLGEGRATKAGFDAAPVSSGARTAGILAGAKRVEAGQHTGSRRASSHERKEHAAHRQFSEFTHLEALALFDYLRKTRSKGYTISLSGGADSAACALLVQRMVLYGITELGVGAFLKRVGLDASSSPNAGASQDSPVSSEAAVMASANAAAHRITGMLLHTVYQGTKQNSPVTREAARTVARALGADHHEIEIDGLVEESRHLVEAVLNRHMEWATDDLTLQNIQARARSPIVWMLANATDSLLIATGNRSESSTGYCTMDGDTSGGLAPIAGIDKAFLLRWLRFMEETGDAHGPVAALGCINRQQPTAELRPLEQKQTDERDLMPYSLLAVIERFALEDLLSPDEITDRLLAQKTAGRQERLATQGANDSGQSPQETEEAGRAVDEILAGMDERSIGECVDRFFALWNRSQWKRERFAVSFHVDSYNLDPRSWLRFPVLSEALRRTRGTEG